MKKQQGSVVLTSLIIVAIWIAFIVGWIINVVEVIHLAFANAPATALFIVKVAGIFVAPLGSILGLFF